MQEAPATLRITEHLIEQVFGFWFGFVGSEDYGKPRSFWFNATPAIDQEIRERFLFLYNRLKTTALEDLSKMPQGTLMSIIVLDQFSRHLFRGTAKAFSEDYRAVLLAKAAICAGFDQALPDFMRPFFYLPLEHSEDLSDQEQSLALFQSLGDAGYLKHALEHYELIKRFGRFPHRNVFLKRKSTEEESLFLNEKNGA